MKSCEMNVVIRNNNKKQTFTTTFLIKIEINIFKKYFRKKMGPLINHAHSLTKFEGFVSHILVGMAKGAISLHVPYKTSTSPIEPPLVWTQEKTFELAIMLKREATDIHAIFEPHEKRDRFIKIMKDLYDELK